MPLYSDSNFYYTASGGAGGSPYYTPGLYGGGSSSSAASSYAPYTATYSRTMTGSYVVPLSTSRSSPSYSSSSSSALASRYQPKLSTITESPLMSGSARHTTLMPLTRIQSPKYSSYTAPTSTLPKYIAPRPININTADIDVSSARYRHHRTTSQRLLPAADEEPKKAVASTSPSGSTNAARREPAAATDTATASEKPSSTAADDGDRRAARTTIKRNRAVVRLSTVRTRSKDRNKTAEAAAEPDEKRFRDLPRAPEENLSWRQKLAQDLAAIPTYPLKKTPGELLRERYLIQEAKDDEVSTPGARHIPRSDTAARVIEEPATIDKVVVELDPMDHTIRRLSIPNCPTFHDICEDISSDKIDDDLNAGVLRRRASLIQEQEQELFNQLQESVSETFQMLPSLERHSSSYESLTDESTGKPKHPSKKTKKRHKITAIVEVENAPLITVEEEVSTPKPHEEVPKPKFTFNVESVEEHHELHKVLKLPKKKSVRKSLKTKKKLAEVLPEGFVPAIPKAQRSPKTKDEKPIAKTFTSTAEIFTFSQQSVEESKADELQNETTISAHAIDEPDISVTMKMPDKATKQDIIAISEEDKPKLTKQKAVVVESSISTTTPPLTKTEGESKIIEKPAEVAAPKEPEKTVTPTPPTKVSEKTPASPPKPKDAEKIPVTPSKPKDSDKTASPQKKDSEKPTPMLKPKEPEKTATSTKPKDSEKTTLTSKESEKHASIVKPKELEKTPTTTLSKPDDGEKATSSNFKSSISIELNSAKGVAAKSSTIGEEKSAATPTTTKPPLTKGKAIHDGKEEQCSSAASKTKMPTNVKQSALKTAASLDNTSTATKATTKILEKTQSLNTEEPKVAAPKAIEKRIQKSESGEDFWSQIGTRESIYMANRKSNILGCQWTKQEDLSELPDENDDDNVVDLNATKTAAPPKDETPAEKTKQIDKTKEDSKPEPKTATPNVSAETTATAVKSPKLKVEPSAESLKSKTAEVAVITATSPSTPAVAKKATATTKPTEQSKATTTIAAAAAAAKVSAEKAPAAVTTTAKISSGQMAKSPEQQQQQAANAKITTAMTTESNNSADKTSVPAAARTAAKGDATTKTIDLATTAVTTKTTTPATTATAATATTTKTNAKTTIETTKQPLLAGGKQTETKAAPKLSEAMKKSSADPKSTSTGATNSSSSNANTLLANDNKGKTPAVVKTAAKKISPANAKKTSPTFNADQFVTTAPPKATVATSPAKNKNASPKTKQTTTSTTTTTGGAAKQPQTTPLSPKVNDNRPNAKATTATTTVGTTTTTTTIATPTSTTTTAATATTSGNENVLAKFATVSNLALCLQDVDGDLDDYIPSSADSSDDDYSSANGSDKLSASMKKKLKQRRRKEKLAAEPARFDPQKKVKITLDTTTKCYTKEQAPRYPLTATPRPLWKREQVNYVDESEDSDSDASGSTEETTEDSEEYTSSSEYEDDLRPTGGAHSDSTTTGGGSKENSAIIRLSTCSNDSGFEGGTAPSSPKKMLGARETRESPSTPPSLNPAYKIEPNEEHDETSYTYSQFQKSGRFTAPATVIPRFKNYTVDDFHFLAVLGKGSFGKVLLAELRDTTYYYAVKCLKKDVVLEDDDVDSTLIERKVLALGTKHPYLCHLFCTFQTESHLFFVMEYLNGGDLMFHIQESGRFTEERARFYGAEIISGLKFLHKKGIIYRDLKLDNVLLDYEGHVRIADFGMCKLQIYLDKTADSFCGTPDYMAPEIIKGEKYNQNVDWWSFGVLLYEMLIGQSPFSGCDEDELFWSICNEVPWFPVYITAEATSILKGLLEKDYTKRVGSQYSLAGDIAEHIFFQPIDWNLLDKRQLEPPFRPQVKHPLDTQYFDRVFTRERVRLTPIDKEILQSMDQKQFHGFTYTNPHITLD